MIKHALIAASFLCTLPSFAEKKPLDHSVYDGWNSIPSSSLSENGRYVLYQVSPQEGDGYLMIKDRTTSKEIKIDRGYNGLLSTNGKNAVCLIKAPFAATRDAKIKKKKAEEMPQDSLAVIELLSGKIEKISQVTSYKTGRTGSEFIAYFSTDTSLISIKEQQNKAIGRPVLIRNLNTGKQDTLKYVKDCIFSYNGQRLAATLMPSEKDSTNRPGVIAVDLYKNKQFRIATGLPLYTMPNYSKDGDKLTFLSSPDTLKSGSKRCNLCFYEFGNDSAKILISSTNTQGIPPDWSVSENGQPYFSRDGKRLFAGISPIRPPKDTTLIDFETAQLDIWNYNDLEIPPMQLKNRDRELKRTYLSVINLNQPHHLIPLGTTEMREVIPMDEGNANWAIGIDNTAYRLEWQWTGANKQDIYLINLANGSRKLIKKGITGYVSPSAGGNYILWYEQTEKQWYNYSVSTGQTTCLTQGMDVAFWDENNDVPNYPSAYGIAGWLPDDKAVWIYDKFDIWQFTTDNSTTPVCITRGEGRIKNLLFRYLPTDPENRFINASQLLLLTAFDKTTKERGYFTLAAGIKQAPVKRILAGFTFSGLSKAKDAQVYIFQKSNFNTSPNLYVTSNLWKTEQELSDINPQMLDYNWGTSELVKWTTTAGIPAEGILYKPENFDPKKKYPLLIYFYEKHSDGLYSYLAPAPSRSIINIPFYCSRGYLVFTPDIYYTTGLPGESAYNSIIPGVEKLCENSWVDRTNMAIQGQSWGGYQVAYLITRTNMFKAAGAGAPVSNMTSAYGGIRWGTGMSRQFQYEHTQSRIGKTLWEAPELYLLNSPVFRADKVNTPLLIMHNDQDGAVPWYQGIELFMALRRLGKPAWLLQYNNEDHNLVQRKNAKDLSIRLQQFFDHYLKGDPMPAWMKDGIPATRKGEYFGFELNQ